MFRYLIAALLTIACTAVYCAGTTPPTLHRLKPRDEWKAVTLDGYIIQSNKGGFVGMFGAGASSKEFAWTDRTDTFGPRRMLQLVFADDAMRRRAEAVENAPMFVSVIEVKRGETAWYLVESITEPN